LRSTPSTAAYRRNRRSATVPIATDPNTTDPNPVPISMLALRVSRWQGRRVTHDSRFRRYAEAACALAVLIGAAGCVAGDRVRPSASAAAPVFDPIIFFAGATHGTGTLHILFSKPRHTDVRGVGMSGATGEITLDQDVVQGDGPTKHRTWRLRRTAPGRFGGTLTDAVGPVVADAQGNVLRIAFTMKGGLRVEQRLYLQSGGRVALNTMTVRKLGIVVARLDERIERVDRGA